MVWVLVTKSDFKIYSKSTERLLWEHPASNTRVFKGDLSLWHFFFNLEKLATTATKSRAIDTV